MQTCRGCPWPCIFCDIPIFNEGKWRSRSPQQVVDEFKHLQSLGDGAVYFVDDQFLLRPKRIEATCKGINDDGINNRWGGARGAWIPPHSTFFQPWRKPVVAR